MDTFYGQSCNFVEKGRLSTKNNTHTHSNSSYYLVFESSRFRVTWARDVPSFSVILNSTQEQSKKTIKEATAHTRKKEKVEKRSVCDFSIGHTCATLLLSRFWCQLIKWWDDRQNKQIKQMNGMQKCSFRKPQHVYWLYIIVRAFGRVLGCS